MSEDFRRDIYIETDIDSYRSFFSDDWASRILKLSLNKLKLYPLVFDLVMEWRASAYTASLPVQILEHVKSYHDGFVKSGEVNTNLLRMMEVVITKLAREVPELVSEPTLVHRLQRKIIDLGAEFEDSRQSRELDFPLKDTWNSYIDHHVYQLGLWGSQRICYLSVYNSYENFLLQCVRIASDSSNCRTTGRDFKKQIVASFGHKIRDKCWTNDRLNVARLARHSLSHAGGRVTKGLAKQKHGFVVVDERIQVTPEKTKILFEILKEAAYVLAEKAVNMSVFD